MGKKSIDMNVNNRNFKKSGKDSFHIFSSRRQFGTHVVSPTRRIRLAYRLFEHVRIGRWFT